MLFLTAMPIEAQSVSYLDNLAGTLAASNNSYKASLARNAVEIAGMGLENNLADPEIEFGHVWGQGHAGNKYDIQISQSFDWPGVYSARNKVSRARKAALDCQTEVMRNELLLNIKLAMLDVINNRKQMELYESIIGSIDSLSAIVAKDVANKDVSILDGNKLKIERIGIMSKYRSAFASYEEACAKIREYNNGEPCPGIIEALTDFPMIEKLKPMEYYLEEAGNNPQILYRSAMEEMYRYSSSAIKKSSLPGFSVGLRHENEEGEKFNGFSVAMTLPFFSQRGKRKVHELENKAMVQESELAVLQSNSEISTSYMKATNLYTEIDEYGKIFNTSDNIRLLNKAFEARHINVLDYISELIYFTDAMSDFLNLQYQYHRTHSVLTRYSSTALRPVSEKSLEISEP